MGDIDRLAAEIGAIDECSKKTARRSVDRMLALRNWLIGACIVEYEQSGEDRAAYGGRVLLVLAARLRQAGVRGLGARNLKNCRKIALTWPHLEIRQTLSAESESPAHVPSLPEKQQTPSAESAVDSLARRFPLPWSAYVRLLAVKNERARR